MLNTPLKSITVDNGVEFLHMESLEKSVYKKLSKRTTIYYSHAYCSWERESNENNNKLIRKFIKRKKILNISQEKIFIKYKIGLIIILESYLIIKRLMIFFLKTYTNA